jgi:hypothetical protein
MNLDPRLPSSARKVHEHVKVTKDREPMPTEEPDRLFIASYRLHIEKPYSSLVSFRDYLAHQLSADTLMPMGFGNYERLHFPFVSFDNQSNETNYAGAPKSDPNVA